MSIKNAYDHWSESYDFDTNRTRDLDQVVTRTVLEKQTFGSILETGCGTGKNTVFLSEICESIHCLDLSPGMLNKAKAKVNINKASFDIADLTKPWPCLANSYDLVVCNLVLEHIEQLPFIFEEANRTLKPGGKLFICELHPFRQYLGTQANFQNADQEHKIEAYAHNISDFLSAAESSSFSLQSLNEWWHEQDQNKPPRLVSFMFKKLR